MWVEWNVENKRIKGNTVSLYFYLVVKVFTSMSCPQQEILETKSEGVRRCENISLLNRLGLKSWVWGHNSEMPNSLVLTGNGAKERDELRI